MAWWASRGRPQLGAADRRMVVWLGLTVYYLASFLDFLGLQYITAGLERLKKNPLRQNQFGFSLGGPVIIPKLYNGKDRTFFNFNYTGLRNSPPLPGNLVSMPTADFLRGDLD